MEHEQGNEGDSDARGSRDESAAVIEDEPASDFYASLVGVNPSAVSRKRRRVLPPTSKTGVAAPSVEDSTTSSSHVVDAKKGEIQRNGHDTRATKSEMAHALHRAFANPTEQTSLSLDKSNKGYALLSAMGWSEDSGGLGKSRQGQMVPVKTTLKMDQRGLGSGTGRRGITHKHDDIEAAAGRKCGNNNGAGPSGETKAQRKKRKKKETQKAARDDKRVRMMLRSDIPPEYEELYMQLHK